MASKKEDNRDIFEKALDNPQTVAAGLLGAFVGGALGRKAVKITQKRPKKMFDWSDQKEMRDAATVLGATTGGASAAYYEHNRPKTKARR